MKISYNWLKQFINIDWNVEKTAELLTDLGLEVEGISKFESIKGSLEGVVVGKVLTCEKHPNADRLNITTVDVGNNEVLSIVCGAPNVAAGQKVPVATIGTKLYDKEDNEFVIKKGKIRGELSHGMICAEDELGLSDDHDGIMVLDEKAKPGTKFSELFEVESDQVFEIGLTPNRADAMSHFGVARDLKAGLMQQGINLELITPSVTRYQPDLRTKKIEIEVDNKELAPRYIGVTISNISIKESPQWLQNRLKAIGINPKNNVIDVTNYVMHELGQPLHAFDAAQIKGGKIVVKQLPADTKFITLDEVERKIHAEDIMICDAESNPLCFGGVFGGLLSGVKDTTNTIFLESAYFNPVLIRKTAKRHGLNTDASFRFERGIDPNLVEYALKRAALLIKETADAEITSEIQEFYPEKFTDHEVVLAYDDIYKLTGQEIPKDTIKNILASLEIKIISETDHILGLRIPPYRVDVQRSADVIEEILRVYGYNNVSYSQKLNTSISFSEIPKEKYENIIANQLVSQGFYEMMSNSLSKPDYDSYSENLKEENAVQILNPLSADLAGMRQSMIFGSLESIAHNLNRKQPNIRAFEFGKTYHKYGEKYTETKHLSLITSGNLYENHWQHQAEKGDFFYLKAIVYAILAKAGIEFPKIKALKNDLYNEGMSLFNDKVKIAEIGLVNPTILKEFDIKQEVVHADILIENLYEIMYEQTIKVSELPKYPSVNRDLALLVDKNIQYYDMYKAAFQAERNLLVEMDLFDVYEGEKLPKGKKSYALSFVLRDPNKTLKDKQIEKIMNKLQQTFEKEFGARLRA